MDRIPVREAHLSRNEHVNLAPMIFIKGEAFVNLRTGNTREATTNYRFDRFAVLEQPNNVMDSNACSFDDRRSATDPRLPRQVAVTQ
jgi:hypothetical protein